MITVFTPTYNRAYILPKLYQSLITQSYTDFEWLIVDDGSNDDTKRLFDGWIHENLITMRYYQVENGGKHRAINKGVRLAFGELFFIVDSDDKLLPNSLDMVAKWYDSIKYDDRFCGLAGSLGNPQGHRIGGYFPSQKIDCNAIDFRLKYGIKGDMAEVFRTDILRKYPFPEFENERFCPEALIWNRIAQKYIMRFIPDIMYVTEYLSDGLTAKIVKLRHSSPQASMLYYSELYRMHIPFKQKIKAAINFWRFANAGYSKYHMTDLLCIICYPFGKLMRFRDKQNLFQ